MHSPASRQIMTMLVRAKRKAQIYILHGKFECNILLSLYFSLCRGRGTARNFFTASSDSLFHPSLSLVFFFQSSSSPAFLTSLLTQSSHISLGLPRLLLPSSCTSAVLFGSLSSTILSTCPALCHLLLTSLSVKLLCTPISSCLPSLLWLFFVPSRFHILAAFVVVVPKFLGKSNLQNLYRLFSRFCSTIIIDTH